MSINHASIFMLWYSPTKEGKTEQPFVNRAEEAIIYFRSKHGFLPTQLIARSDEITLSEGEDTVLGVSIIPMDTGVTPKHFLLGDV